MGFAFGGGKLSTTEECSSRAWGLHSSGGNISTAGSAARVRVGFATVRAWKYFHTLPRCSSRSWGLLCRLRKCFRKRCVARAWGLLEARSGNIATVSPGKPHACELHNVFPRWQRFHNSRGQKQTPRVRAAPVSSGNVSLTHEDNGQTP